MSRLWSQDGDPLTLLDFPREIGLKRAMCHDKNQWDSYVRVLGTKSSCYTSLYSFKELKDGRINYDTVIIDRAWWDFDSNDDYRGRTARCDGQRLPHTPTVQNARNRQNLDA